MYQQTFLSYENVIAKIGLTCTILLKILVKNDKFIKIKFVTILILDILLNFSVKVRFYLNEKNKQTKNKKKNNKKTEYNTKFALREGPKIYYEISVYSKKK